MDHTHLLTVEVHYIEQDINGYTDTPAYRLFLDNELFTERSWFYNKNTFLLENIHFTSADTNHSILVKPAPPPWPEENYFNFMLKNLTIDGVLVEPNDSGSELCFTINTLL
jgi:hypothetical protein